MALPKGLTAARIGAGGLLKFILRHWYFIILLIVIIPTIVSSISVARETQNPFYPLIQLGLHLGNADAIIYEDVQTLKENPAELIGATKPENGIWLSIVYYWSVFKVVWKELGLIWLIAFPFVVFFRIFKARNKSETAKNIVLTIVFGLIFIFIINLIMAVHGLATESITYTFPEGIDMYEKTGLIIWTTLPFHGVISLIGYLFGLI